MRRAEDVLSGLNEMFPMEEHRDMFFTAWYGVYHGAERQIRYCCGGHHPGYLVGPGRETATPLWTRNPLVGAKRAHALQCASATVVPGSTLYLFSDGPVRGAGGRPGSMQGLDDFVPLLLLAGGSGDTTEPERLVRSVRRMTQMSAFEDDVTLLVATFP
jgi:sigma-B regulation protein RsbU (phosphoserine phosphatase)